MRFGFVTCVQLGLSCMEALYEVGGKLELAVTLRDELAAGKSGRVYLDDFCSINGIPLIKCRNINERQIVDAIQEAGLDWLFVIGWSQIAGPGILRAPRRGVLGMHPTLLPQGRGRAAIPWAILKDLKTTGVTLFKLDGGVDTGPIIKQIEIALSPTIDANSLYQEVASAHAALVKSAYPQLIAETLELAPQDEGLASIWPTRTPEDGRIDLKGSAVDAERLIRAVTHPYPGAFFIEGGRKIIVWEARLKTANCDCYPGDHLEFEDGILCLLKTEVIEVTG